MSEPKENTGGILKGLKKLLFNDEAEIIAPLDAKPVANTPPPHTSSETSTSTVSVDQNAKLKVYQLLEGINKSGVDFFEVWNASIEMGGANATNIKSAYTSLKYADNTLSKAKLEDTGNFYISEIEKILGQESQKRKHEIEKLEAQKSGSKASLAQEITDLEAQIASLQERLGQKKAELENINQNYDPQIAELQQRILTGEASVNSVIQEMKDVLAIITQEIK